MAAAKRKKKKNIYIYIYIIAGDVKISLDTLVA